MLFFRLAEGLSTSRFEPSISISIKTGLKSFLKFVRVLSFSLEVICIFSMTHPFLRPDDPRDSSTVMVGGSEVFLVGMSFPSWQWLHLYETTSPRHGLLMIKMTDTDNVGIVRCSQRCDCNDTVHCPVSPWSLSPPSVPSELLQCHPSAVPEQNTTTRHPE